MNQNLPAPAARPPAPCSVSPDQGELSASAQPSKPRPGFRLALLASCGALWVIGGTVGFLYALHYETTPAATGPAGQHWPAGSCCPLAANLPTLVMFVHPQCPCSRASLHELSLLLTHCQGRIQAHVLFWKPATQSDDWVRSDLWDAAACIPGVTPHVDPGGAERQRFGARASGEVYLYQPDGSLTFHGGITAGRGHQGDNRGRSLIETQILQQHRSSDTAPVFGCPFESATCRALIHHGKEATPADE